MDWSLIGQLPLALKRAVLSSFGVTAKSADPLQRPNSIRQALIDAHPNALSANGWLKPYAVQGAWFWQILHSQDANVYGDAERPEMFRMLSFDPQFVLDVGCNTGMMGESIKRRYPATRVWGVEPLKSAAALARGRLDRVLDTPLEDVDWLAFGVAPGEIDTVVLYDVLEHLYDPWRALLLLRSLVHRQAQLLVSIPNARNAYLIQDLANGYWRYRHTGILDATHIRFFTLLDLTRMFYQTGFRIERTAHTLDHRGQALYEAHRSRPYPQELDLQRVQLRVDSEADLLSLCALQHQFTLRPVERAELSADERAWIDDPHPETFAFGGGA